MRCIAGLIVPRERPSAVRLGRLVTGAGTTGSGGYCGNRGSVRDRSQKRKRLPRSLVTSCTNLHDGHRPSTAFGCCGCGRSFMMTPCSRPKRLTRGVRVSVLSEYAPDRSSPPKNEWFFLYTITITNEGADACSCCRATGSSPTAAATSRKSRARASSASSPCSTPGESFTYTSGCPLATPFGTMEGTYQMVTRAGEFFDVTIAPFTLSEPYTVH